MNIKNFCIGVVIISIVLFTIVSLLSIWEIIKDSEFTSKSLMSLAIICFSGLVGVVLSEKMKKPFQ